MYVSTKFSEEILEEKITELLARQPVHVRQCSGRENEVSCVFECEQLATVAGKKRRPENAR